MHDQGDDILVLGEDSPNPGPYRVGGGAWISIVALPVKSANGDQLVGGGVPEKMRGGMRARASAVEPGRFTVWTIVHSLSWKHSVGFAWMTHVCMIRATI